MRLARLAITTALAAALLAACSDNTTGPRHRGTTDPFDMTPREDYEAEVVALALSGELIAPQDLYLEVRDGLGSLRAQFHDSIPPLQSITFRPCWMPGEIAGMLTEAASAEVRAGTYTGMDSLNAVLRLARMDTTSFSFSPAQIYYHLHFEGRLHPERLVEMYRDLPSVETVNTGYICFDGSALYPRIIDGGVGYLFRRAWGDCPAGCIFSEFWYFRVRSGVHVEYVGHWDPQNEPAPQWWEEARAPYCEARGGGRYCAD
jgi:hypothetical protein